MGLAALPVSIGVAILRYRLTRADPSWLVRAGRSTLGSRLRRAVTPPILAAKDQSGLPERQRLYVASIARQHVADVTRL